MSEQRDTGGLEVYVRGNVSRNTKGWNSEHTVSVQGQVMVALDETDRLVFWVKTGRGTAPLSEVLDTLHQEADAANQREIDRQREQQLVAVRAG